MEFALLGPLEVRRQGVEVPVRRGRPRTVLISLLLQTGRAVPADLLIDRVWGDDLPTNASNALQVHVSYLRNALGLPATGEAPALRTVAGGYLLDVAPDSVDVHRFERAVATAAELLTRSRPDGEEALTLLRTALDLWRGEPLPELADEPFVIPEVERLRELHASALEHEIEARLLLGQHEAVVPALRQLVADHPVRERLRAQLILALYRSGRQADALRAYDAARRHLVDELGVDPGAELQRLQRAVLQHDPALDWNQAPGAAPTELRRGGASTLPAPTTRLVGRERELARIGETMRDSRMVTLVGPGGAGKSRLALAVAHAEAARCPVWLVELADVGDPSIVPYEIARAVEVVSTADPLDAVTMSVGNQPALLVLDTCEHQLDPCAEAARFLLRACPNLAILATSRQRLGVVGEVAWPVPPLTLPAPDASTADVMGADSVTLFCERARAARPDFELDASNAGTVAEICRTVDALPLAIELAAARISVLSPRGILERLDDRFTLLSRVGRAADLRQRSLRAAIEWSDELLDEDQRTFFRRLGVFAGRFTLDAAGPIAAHGLLTDPLELMSAMVDRSLVVTNGDDTYRMLDSLRAFAAERLVEADRDATRHRFGTWCAEEAEAAQARIRGPGQVDARARLRVQLPNLRAALEWAFTQGDTRIGVRLARSLAWFWALEGANTEARRWLDAALATPGVEEETRAALTEALGIHLNVLGHVAEAQHVLQTAVGLWDEVGEPQRGVTALMYLGLTQRWFGCLDVAAANQDRAIALSREHGDDWGLAWALLWRAGTAADQGDGAAANAMLDESRQAAERAGDPCILGWIVKELAESALRADDLVRATDLIGEAVTILEAAGWKEGLTAVFTGVGRALLARGRIDESFDHLRRALRMATDLGMAYAIAEALEGLAEAVRATDDHEASAELLGAASAVRSRMGATKLAMQRQNDVDALTAELRDVLGHERFGAAFTRGSRRAPTEVSDLFDAA